jgi:hypothetical protein
MVKKVLLRVLVCLLFSGVMLYSYLKQQNDLTQLRIDLPLLSKEIKTLQQDNIRLRYEIERFESPEHLLSLARLPEYSHLKHPIVKEILVVPEGLALEMGPSQHTVATASGPKVNIALGAKQ